MIKVLGLALYGPLAASTRYRLGQFVPGLATYGIDLEIRHLLGDAYLRRRFSSGTMPVPAMLQASWQRLGELRGQRRYDALMLHCELFPLMPGWAERALLRCPYIYDFDDAFYLKYRTGRMRWLRGVLGHKFETVMRGAAAITAGNRFLADYARAQNPNTSCVRTVVDTDRYLPARISRRDEFTVGWIGSPSTSSYLSHLVAPLSTIGREGPVRLVVVGGKAPSIPNVTIEEREWSEETEIALINSFDVGVMPLPDDAWARGKCAFKLIQYMACGVPVVASPVGANVDVVQDDAGLLAASDSDWVAAFRELRDDVSLRRKMGDAGRARVEAEFSLRRNLPILAEVIRKTVNGAVVQRS